LSDTDVHRIRAAINAEHANAEVPSQQEPHTEPLSRVTGSGPETKDVGNPLRTGSAKSTRLTKAPRVDESLRAAKALQASAELRAAEKPRTEKPRGTEGALSATGRLRPEEPVLVPGPVRAEEPVLVPGPVQAEEPALVPEPARAKQPVIAAEPQRLEPRTAWPAGEPPPGTIGWLWPERTATRTGSAGWQRLGWWAASARWRYRTATLVALGAVVLVAAGLVLSMLLHSSVTSTGAHAPTGPKASTHAPAKSSKRHATKQSRGGRSAAARRSPASHALNRHVQARIRSGRQLLASGKVSASAAAESDLAAGAVDQRLLLVIEAIANVEPVDVLGFANPGPGASSPFRLMDLAETDPAASVSAPVYLHQMIALLQAHATFPAFSQVGQVTLNGQKAVQVEYAAPTPLAG
jgi:hypothetical protein